jgi:CBS domain-containing protein
MEQTLLTDQDNALVFADEGAAHRDWFRRLAERTNGDLEAAGFPHCPGGYMASKWHGSLSEWKGRFGHWEDDPVPQALLEASIFFDFRRVSGLLDLAPLEAVVAEASGKPVFLRFLAQAALGFRTPQALLLRLKGESSTVDLKLQGISPIVFLARVYGLEVGSTARNTLARLQGAHGAGLMGEEAFGSVSEAYRFLLGLRLRLQLRMLADGRQVTNVVALSELNAIERSRLKDSFRAIKAWQEKAAYHYQLDF